MEADDEWEDHLIVSYTPQHEPLNALFKTATPLKAKPSWKAMCIGRYNNFYQGDSELQSPFIKWMWENRKLTWPLNLKFISRSCVPGRRYIFTDGRTVYSLNKQWQAEQIYQRKDAGITQVVEWMNLEFIFVDGIPPIVVKDQKELSKLGLKNEYRHNEQQKVYCTNSHIYYPTGHHKIATIGEGLSQNIYKWHEAHPAIFMVREDGILVAVDISGKISTSSKSVVATLHPPLGSPHYCNILSLPVTCLTLVVAHELGDKKVYPPLNVIKLLREDPDRYEWMELDTVELHDPAPLSISRRLKKRRYVCAVFLMSPTSASVYFVALWRRRLLTVKLT